MLSSTPCYWTYVGRQGMECRQWLRLTLRVVTEVLEDKRYNQPICISVGLDYQSNSDFTFFQRVTNLIPTTTLWLTGRYPGRYSMTAWNRNTVQYVDSCSASIGPAHGTSYVHSIHFAVVTCWLDECWDLKLQKYTLGSILAELCTNCYDMLSRDDV